MTANSFGLRGLLTASLTPLESNLAIDADKMVSHCRWLLDNGCDGLVIWGTTGEANSFSLEERTNLLDTLIAAGIDPQKLLVGTGCCALPDTLRLSRHAAAHDVAGLLLLPPFYYKNVSDRGLFQAIEQLLKQLVECEARIYLYHFPKMAAVSFSRPLVSSLVDAFPERIIGIKDSSGDWQNVKALHETLPGFQVFSGNELILSEILGLGAAGCISATTNLTCRLAANVKDSFPGTAAAQSQATLNAIRKEIQKYPMIPALKYLMAQKTGDPAWQYMRPPLTPLSEPETGALLRTLQELQLLQFCT